MPTEHGEDVLEKSSLGRIRRSKMSIDVIDELLELDWRHATLELHGERGLKSA